MVSPTGSIHWSRAAVTPRLEKARFAPVGGHGAKVDGVRAAAPFHTDRLGLAAATKTTPEAFS